MSQAEIPDLGQGIGRKQCLRDDSTGQKDKAI
jgi:hypothetical protein